MAVLVLGVASLAVLIGDACLNERSEFAINSCVGEAASPSCCRWWEGAEAGDDDDDTSAAPSSFMQANSFGSLPTCGGC